MDIFLREAGASVIIMEEIDHRRQCRAVPFFLSVQAME
jgi:hypothetical protein